MSDIKYPSRSSKGSQKIGGWIKTQRRAYKKGELSRRRVQKLEQIPGWDWSVLSRNSSGNKIKLLELARAGKPKPLNKTKLGMYLKSYVQENASYDAEFDKRIRKLAPQWFVKSVEIKKKKLLEMARNGEPRPSSKTTTLGQALCSYTGCVYDAEFDNQIRKLAPQWFVKSSDVNKARLLEMARNGEPRPHGQTSRLGRALTHYTSKSRVVYDASFDAKIRKAAPHWGWMKK